MYALANEIPLRYANFINTQYETSGSEYHRHYMQYSDACGYDTIENCVKSFQS